MKKILLLTFIFCCGLTAAVFGRVYGGTVLYNMTFKFSFKFLLPLILGAAAFFVTKNYFKDTTKAAISGAAVLAVLFLLLCFPRIKIYSDYKTGNYTETAGAVKDFQTSDSKESFALDGVEFSYKNGSGNGYNIVQSKGGVIKGDSQLIYIRYVKFFGKKVICYIENVL